MNGNAVDKQKIINFLLEIEKMSFPIDPEAFGKMQGEAFILATDIKYSGVENE